MATPTKTTDMPDQTTLHRGPTDDPGGDRRGMLLVISGPSGVGKTTIRDAILAAEPDAYFSISATTRPKTDADVDGVDYHFISDERFEEHVRNNEFFEHAVFAGNKYGTLKAPVEQALREGRLVLLDVDVVGAGNIKRMCPDAYFVFFMPPSKDELLRRLRERQRDTKEAIQKRFDVASREIDDARSSDVYDVFVINDDLDRAIAETLTIVEREKNRRGC